MLGNHFPLRFFRAASSGPTFPEVIPDMLDSVVCISDEPRPVNHQESRNAQFYNHAIHSVLPMLKKVTCRHLMFRLLRFKLIGGNRYAS